MTKQLGHKDIEIKRLKKRIRELEGLVGGEVDVEYEAKIARNSWEQSVFDNIIPAIQETLDKVKKREWSWSRNMSCKYVDIRIDMRDGGAIMYSGGGGRISTDQLRYQYKSGDENE